MSKKYIRWTIVCAALLIALLLGVFSPESPVPFFEEEEKLISDEPDAFIVDGVYTSYGRDGYLESVLKSAQAKHYPITNIGHLIEPSLQLFQEGELRWTTTSEHGEFDVTKDTLMLSGNVTVYGETSNGTPLLIKTESVTYANKSGFIHTEEAVTITSQVSKISAVGMTADVADRTVKLLSEVKGKYEPK